MMKKHQIEIPDIPFLERSVESERRICAKDGCSEDGNYKAPRSTHDVHDYIWFCLDHVREYNKSWNYFDGMDEIGMEDAIRRSTIWERPSWKFGTSNKKRSSAWQKVFHDPLGLFGDGGNLKEDVQSPPYYSADECKALAIFGLSSCTDTQEVKKRYKALAKANHPDANGGSVKAEERLKMINWAYAILKKTMSEGAV
jgi:curved DNA-binding protein CbpA